MKQLQTMNAYLFWPSRPGYGYDIERTDQLDPVIWTRVVSGLPPAPPANTWQDPGVIEAQVQGYYRIIERLATGP